MTIPAHKWGEVIPWTPREIIENWTVLRDAIVTAAPQLGEPLVVAIPALVGGTFRLLDLGDIIWVENVNQFGERSFRVITNFLPEIGLVVRMARGINRQI